MALTAATVKVVLSKLVRPLITQVPLTAQVVEPPFHVTLKPVTAGTLSVSLCWGDSVTVPSLTVSTVTLGLFGRAW